MWAQNCIGPNDLWCVQELENAITAHTEHKSSIFLVVLQTWFTQLQTNKFQIFKFSNFQIFQDKLQFSRTTIYSINRHSSTPFWTPYWLKHVMESFYQQFRFWSYKYMEILYENCGVKNYMREEHRSYIRNFCSCEKKALKNSGLYGIRTLNLCDTGAALYQLGAGRWIGSL